MVAKVIEQEVFPSEVLKARANESSKTTKVAVDPDNVDGDVDTYNVTPPPSSTVVESPPTGSDAPPTRNNAPPTSLPINHHTTNTQTLVGVNNSNQVNTDNHI